MIRNSIFLICGKIVSVFGARVFSFALSFFILSETGSALSFTISLALNYLPQIFISPFAGVMADKVSIKIILIVCDFMSGTIIGALLFLDINIYYFYICSFLLSCISSVFSVVADAGIPTIMGLKNSNHLQKINTIMQLVTSLTIILAPPLSGVLVTFVNVKVLFGLSCSAFYISALSEGFIRFQPRTRMEIAKKVSVFEDIRDTIKYIQKITFLRVFFFSEGILNFFYILGVTSTVSYIILSFLKMPPWQMGMVSGTLSAGSVVAAFILLKRCENITKTYKYPFERVLLLAINILLYGVFVFLIYENKLNPSIGFLCILVLFFINGAMGVLINVPVSTALQVICEEGYRGKVVGSIRSFGYVLTPIAMLMSGFILDHYSAYWVPVISGIIMILSICILYIWQKRIKGE